VPRSSIERRIARCGWRADRHLHEIPLMAEDFVLTEDLGDRLVGRTDRQMSTRTAADVELRPRERRPAAFAADAAHHFGIGREEGLDRGLGRVGEKAVAIDAELQLLRRNARPAPRLAVKRRQRREPCRLAAYDRDRQRQAERPGACHRLGRAAGRDPDGQGVLQRARVDALSVQWRTMLALPDRTGVRTDREQEVELLGGERVVVVEVQTEQRKGFDKRAAPGHDLRPSARQQIERRELLIDAHRQAGFCLSRAYSGDINGLGGFSQSRFRGAMIAGVAHRVAPTKKAAGLFRRRVMRAIRGASHPARGTGRRNRLVPKP
jgi:hypothetical protein